MKLDRQGPVGIDIPPEAGGSSEGRLSVSLNADEALLWVSVARSGNGPNLSVNAYVADRSKLVPLVDPSSWAIGLIVDQYMSRIVSISKRAHWEGFFYPKENYVLVIETGSIVSVWNTTEARASYQIAKVIEE